MRAHKAKRRVDGVQGHSRSSSGVTVIGNYELEYLEDDPGAKSNNTEILTHSLGPLIYSLQCVFILVTSMPHRELTRGCSMS